MRSHYFRFAFIVTALFAVLALINSTGTASAHGQGQIAQGWQNAFSVADQSDVTGNHSAPARPSNIVFATATSIRFNPVTPTANVPFSIIVQVKSTDLFFVPAGSATLDLIKGIHIIPVQTLPLNAKGGAVFTYTANASCYVFGAQFNPAPGWLASAASKTFCFQ